MKITIDRDDLVFALAFCRTILRSGEAAILSNCMIVAEAGRLTISAHGIYSSKDATVAAKVFEPGQITLPLEHLYQIASGASKNQSINIVVKDRATISWGRSRYTLGTLPIDQFPKMLAADMSNLLILDEQSRQALFSRPAKLLLSDESVLLYSGTYLHDRAGKIASIGSDGTRMLCCTIDQPWSGRASAMVPRLAALEINRMAAERVWWDRHVIVAHAGNCRFSARLLEASYAGYEAIILGTDTPALEFNRKELGDAISRLAALANHGSIVKLDWTDNPKTALLQFVSGDGQETIACSGKISAGSLGLAPIRFGALMDVLSGDKIHMHIDKPMRPIRIVAPAEPSTLCMAAPCLIKS